MSQAHRIIYTNTEGNTAVVIPSPEWKGTMQELQALLQSRGDMPAVDTPEIVPVTDIPADRTFRNAWKRGEQGKKIGVDMLKGQNIAHDKRRAKRELELAPLDKEININVANQTTVQQIEAQRQVIRAKYATMQTAIDAATTPEELLAIIATEGL